MLTLIQKYKNIRNKGTSTAKKKPQNYEERSIIRQSNIMNKKVTSTMAATILMII